MQILNFTGEHIAQAARVGANNYKAERERVPALPPMPDWPNMDSFVRNGLGVAALDGGEMLGYLCVWDPWAGAFGISGLSHVFSPMHGNGTVPENRARIYAKLYQAAAEKWARAGAASHGVCLYAHDTVGQQQFFRYGFGMRTVDAVRGMDAPAASACGGYTFSELAPEEVLDILPLANRLNAGFRESPFFMHRQPHGEAEFLSEYEKVRPVYFVARREGEAVAFIRAEPDGETFVQNAPNYLHVKGMYCLPEHRGKGIASTLLSVLVEKLKADGYTHLGVDFESFNPSGSGFWRKHFTPYTCGVVRRIDENAVTR